MPTSDIPTHHRPRVALLLGVVLTTLATFTVFSADKASAAAEAAAVPPGVTVIADVHTDAIATFWEGGQLVLASKADTPAPRTRYEADQVWFHVDNDSKIASFPAGYEFIAPGGTAVWVAPEVQEANQIWPGFSLESVPAGTLDNDNTKLTLVGVAGPGDLELWQTGPVGDVNRLWSSDEAGFKSFTRKNVHMHANWAFTAAGTYHVTVRADATVGGAPVTDTAVYTFVVGDLPTTGPDPDAVATSIDAAPVTQTYGQTAKLSVSVSPATATGEVTVTAGSHVLTGALSGGTATVTLPAKALSPGGRSVAIAYAGVAGKFKASTGTAAVKVAKATPRVKVARAATKVKRGRPAAFAITVAANGVKPTGKVTVKVAGRSKTVQLDGSGTATAKVTIPRRTKPGPKTVKVAYGGDTYVLPGATSTRLTTTR